MTETTAWFTADPAAAAQLARRSEPLIRPIPSSPVPGVVLTPTWWQSDPVVAAVLSTMERTWPDMFSSTHTTTVMVVRYTQGKGFRRHRDVDRDARRPGAARRVLSASVQLTDAGYAGDYQGGNLVLWPNGDDRPTVTAPPTLGTGVCFHSETVAHEVTKVLRGRRLSLIVWRWAPAQEQQAA